MISEGFISKETALQPENAMGKRIVLLGSARLRPYPHQSGP
jgi:hypothetical protein